VKVRDLIHLLASAGWRLKIDPGAVIDSSGIRRKAWSSPWRAIREPMYPSGPSLKAILRTTGLEEKIDPR
jgi:hypothetical protein